MKRLIVAVSVVLIGIASATKADEITISSGSVELATNSGITTAVLLGTNTDISAIGINPVTITFGAGPVGTITPNGSLNVSGNGSTEQIGGVMFPGSDTLQGSLSLTTAPFTAGVQSGSLAFFQTPFSLTGSVSAFNPMGTLLGTSSINGTGNAAIIAQTTTSGGVTSYSAQQINYQFAAGSTATTPEPSGILLLTLVLGGGWMARRKLGFAE